MAIKNPPEVPRNRWIGNLLLFVGLGFLLLNLLFPQLFAPRPPQVPYSMFIHQVQEGKVVRAYVSQNEILYQLKPEEDKPPQVLATTPIFDLELPKLLQEKGVEFAAAPPPRNSWLLNVLGWVIPPIVFVLIFQFFASRQVGGGPQGVLSISKSRAKVYVEGANTGIRFDDVAGVEEAKAELVEIVDFLKNPQRYIQIGARIPKGVLLVGPPGTGKTLLAKAVAGEANVPFFSISGSEFVELFVGVGSARVRDLFEQAKKQAPCIVFIDELDAIGKSRSSAGFYGGNDEREQTLNQLLTEMDGFDATGATVIVLAATNRPETLDPALLRPGRFDRQVLVDRPDLSGREAILKIHAKKVKLAPEVDLHAIAARTPGFAGADLANLVNEAALLAARNQREVVTQQDFAEAIERIVAGLEKKSRVLNDKEKKIVAYHEVGHALVGCALPGSGRVEKISIVPRGMAALGYTLQLPTEDRFLLDEQELRAQIATLLGGRSAEEIVFGTITTGAANDLQRATDLAERMVRSYGMSKVLGPLAFEQQQASFLTNNGMMLRAVSEETAQAIDREVKEIVESAHQQALSILKENRDLLEAIAQKLLEKEVIEGEELHELLSQVKTPTAA
ncbi:ATP-dependent zinc metalloprotease FtsH4 [Thermosynechococcus sp. JY1334]|uniref:ATP-dependent zinc metalloprotease FtsH4 n=1 Tax=unclassified Thermosynechococcus TaxID=2622553 RepID=UPI00267283C4|nr:MULTISPECIES: ATP-dependent zinc metalloprotease FtsH4 [unclassified Thermosynechococcus]MDR7898911.1 ATP-dependent zinc metalloprotease FtsH4 [Thermosynechococcus sp. JY1332]MDR7906316.1 ATP-dependent zinc metalloprotease FtsH4 [Thermosynechococcus sp. JY1334]MDR7994135.1 ATP-dependent zinc metalloprotease FtsH4 [Thermosynechococcus sp. TG252]WKT86037.1 ATP-dependent zinc metalloprotease FtsH4 [Thermosynechococcus sp. JY1339]WNC54981.1 ATP-dependent zinc metalloprotease FtsH4 [Thermosynech